jgi:hypothetical protein
MQKLSLVGAAICWFSALILSNSVIGPVPSIVLVGVGFVLLGVGLLGDKP